MRDQHQDTAAAEGAPQGKACPTTAAEVVTFWRDAGPSRWFARSEAFDRECETRFLAAHHAAARREMESWMADAEGALALLILLDQIPRNVFRDSAHAYATDPLARHYAQRACDALSIFPDGSARRLTEEERQARIAETDKRITDVCASTP